MDGKGRSGNGGEHRGLVAEVGAASPDADARHCTPRQNAKGAQTMMPAPLCKKYHSSLVESFPPKITVDQAGIGEYPEQAKSNGIKFPF